MPTIDIRGQAPGAGGGAKDPKLVAEEQRRRAMIRAYQNTVRKEIDDAAKESLSKEKNRQKEIADRAKTQEQQRRSLEKDARDRAASQRRQTQEALRIEKQQQKLEASEIKKKQVMETRVAEKAEREKTRTEQNLIKNKQKEELKAAKQAEKEKLQSAKDSSKAAKQQAADAAKAQKAQIAAAAQAQKAQVAAVKQQAQQAKAAVAAQTAQNKIKAIPFKMQPTFARQQSALLAYFNGQNNPPPPPNPPNPPGPGPGGGRARPNRPFFRHNAGDILAESFSGAAIAGLVPTFAKIFGAIIGASIEAPLISGQIQRGMLSLAGPMIDLKKSSYGLARAGGFKGADLTSLLYPGTGTEQGSEWMSRYMTNPQKVADSLSAFGIPQKNAWRTAGLGETFARQALMPGFSGLPEGTVESVSRQRAGYSNMPVENIEKYLNQIGGAMEMAVAKGMDRAKVLDSIQGTMEQIAKSGAAGISNKAILDMIARFGAAGTPGGRTGEQAAAAMGAMGQFASSPSGNPGMMFMAYSQMRKYGGLRTENDIKQFVGDDNWNAASPAVRKLAVRDITAASASGNPFAAFQIASSALMGANPNRMAELIQPALNAAFPSFLRTSALGSIMGGTQNAYAYQAGAGATSPASKGVLSELPPGVGSAENSAAQATLSGANIALQNFVPIVKSLSEEFEKLGRSVFTVNKFYEAVHAPPQSQMNWGGLGANISDYFGKPLTYNKGLGAGVNPLHQ